MPHRGEAPTAPGPERSSGDASGGGPSEGTPKAPRHGRSGAGSVYGLVQAMRGLERLGEEPEKEVPRRTLEGTLSAAEALARRDPALGKAYEAVQAYEAVRAKEAALQKTLGAYAAAEAKLKGAAEGERGVARLSETFDAELARTFRDPQAARRAFAEMTEERGTRAAAETLRHRPEHFGPVVAR